jgi:putative exporter of polyketide antibiotics
VAPWRPSYAGAVIKVLLVVAVVAAVVYGLVWALERRRTGAGITRPRPQRKIVAPDDDEDFLRSLETERDEHDGDGPEDPRQQG